MASGNVVFLSQAEIDKLLDEDEIQDDIEPSSSPLTVPTSRQSSWDRDFSNPTRTSTQTSTSSNTITGDTAPYHYLDTDIDDTRNRFDIVSKLIIPADDPAFDVVVTPYEQYNLTPEQILASLDEVISIAVSYGDESTRFNSMYDIHHYDFDKLRGIRHPGLDGEWLWDISRSLPLNGRAVSTLEMEVESEEEGFYREYGMVSDNMCADLPMTDGSRKTRWTNQDGTPRIATRFSKSVRRPSSPLTTWVEKHVYTDRGEDEVTVIKTTLRGFYGMVTDLLGFTHFWEDQGMVMGLRAFKGGDDVPEVVFPHLMPKKRNHVVLEPVSMSDEEAWPALPRK